MARLATFWPLWREAVSQKTLKNISVPKIELNFTRRRILTYARKHYRQKSSHNLHEKKQTNGVTKQPIKLPFQVTLIVHNLNHNKQLWNISSCSSVFDTTSRSLKINYSSTICKSRIISTIRKGYTINNWLT